MTCIVRGAHAGPKIARMVEGILQPFAAARLWHRSCCSRSQQQPAAAWEAANYGFTWCTLAAVLVTWHSLAAADVGSVGFRWTMDGPMLLVSIGSASGNAGQ